MRYFIYDLWIMAWKITLWTACWDFAMNWVEKWVKDADWKAGKWWQNAWKNFASKFNAAIKSWISIAIAKQVFDFWKETLQLAAVAEWVTNKFNVVFGEFSWDVRKFLDDNDAAFAGSRTALEKQASSLQDLLVPLWLSREESAWFTKEFITLWQQIGAFNDVDPWAVVEDFSRALAWSWEALLKYGIDASKTSLVQRAVKEWLVASEKAFNKLTKEQQKQITAEALLIQAKNNSSDAIDWFAANTDSLLFRQLQLQESFLELKTVLWTTLIPIVDSVVKKLIPLIEKVGKRAEENPKLATTIAAVAWWLAILSPFIITIWGAIVKLVSIFWLLKKAIVVIKWFWLAMKALLLANPIWLIAIAVWAAVFLIIKNRDLIKEKRRQFMVFIRPTIDNLRSDREKLKNWISEFADKASSKFESFKTKASAVFNFFRNVVTVIIQTAINLIVWYFNFRKSAVELVISWIKTAIRWVVTVVQSSFNRIKWFIQWVIDKFQLLLSKVSWVLSWIREKVSNFRLPSIRVPSIFWWGWWGWSSSTTNSNSTAINSWNTTNNFYTSAYNQSLVRT